MASDIIVLDASVALEWALPGNTDRHRSYAEAVLLSIVRGEVVAHAPELMAQECAYVLGKAIDKGRISVEKAQQIAQALDQVTGNIHMGRAPFVSGALALARRYGLAAYDACYFDLAMYLGCSIAAIDGEIRGACARFDVPLFLSHLAA